MYSGTVIYLDRTVQVNLTAFPAKENLNSPSVEKAMLDTDFNANSINQEELTKHMKENPAEICS